MAKDHFNYPALMDAALRGIVRTVLAQTAERGTPGSHHFYLSFRTGFPGVEIPDYLREKYPEEITIVIQHQYWGLEVDEEKVSVTLSFRDIHERLVVPFAAMTGFADPSVSFGLQFEAKDAGSAPAPAGSAKPAGSAQLHALPVPAPAAGDGPDADSSAGDQADERPPAPKTGEVVTLDAFRKK